MICGSAGVFKEWHCAIATFAKTTYLQRRLRILGPEGRQRSQGGDSRLRRRCLCRLFTGPRPNMRFRRRAGLEDDAHGALVDLRQRPLSCSSTARKGRLSYPKTVPFFSVPFFSALLAREVRVLPQRVAGRCAPIPRDPKSKCQPGCSCSCDGGEGHSLQLRHGTAARHLCRGCPDEAVGGEAVSAEVVSGESREKESARQARH